MTSDGLPACEMAAALAAGDHANLTQVLGRVVGHPDGTLGVVMTLIAPGYCNLAGPPSFESCTRDVYAADARFAFESVLHMARGVASALAHLHDRGIMHGDLYAHNLFANPMGRFCWAISGLPLSMVLTAVIWLWLCSAWRCGLLLACWRNGWHAVMRAPAICQAWKRCSSSCVPV